MKGIEISISNYYVRQVINIWIRAGSGSSGVTSEV
jgi:hypothetical protein